MLVLTRKCEQSVVVDGCGGASEVLTVTVLEIRGGRVKLGFDVADHVPVHRKEVWERINGNDAADSPTGGHAERITRSSFNTKTLGNKNIKLEFGRRHGSSTTSDYPEA